MLNHSLEKNLLEIDTRHISNSFIQSKIEPEHGTTTLAFVFKHGIVVAVDSRATAGSYIASQSVNKVIEINKYLIGTMAGGAADCFYWEKLTGLYAKRYELENETRITAAAASMYLSNCVNRYKGYGLSMGTMICGYDESGPQIYQVTDRGERIKNHIFSVGSGSTIALGILSSRYKFDMTKEDALDLGRDAIFYAGHRDAFSGGTVNVYFMNEEGWTKIERTDFDEIRDSKSI
jgi:20S proteasome subunit beta 5